MVIWGVTGGTELINSLDRKVCLQKSISYLPFVVRLEYNNCEMITGASNINQISFKKLVTSRLMYWQFAVIWPICLSQGLSWGKLELLFHTVCQLCFCQLDTIWDNRTSIEELPSSDWSMGIFLIVNWYRRAHPTMGSTTLGRWVWVVYERQLSKRGGGSKPASSISLWSLPQFLPLYSCLELLLWFPLRMAYDLEV